MPITIEVDSGSRVILARITGVLTHDDILGYQQDVWSRPEVVGFDEIIDVTAVERIAFESSRRVGEIAALGATMDSKDKPTRLAIVAPTPESYGMARMYQTYRETTPGGTKAVKVFHSMAEAWAWLGKKPSVADTTIKSPQQKA
jgi:hypothetical protein